MSDSRPSRLRPAGRVIVLDPDNRVLLFRYDDGPPNGRHWCTPGGGLNEGEDYAAGARRELAEETGWTDVALGEEVFERTLTMEYEDEIVRQQERFFLARVPAARRGLGEVADMHLSDGIAAWRWWTLAEMDSTAEIIWPSGLADLIRGVLGQAAAIGPERVDGSSGELEHVRRRHRHSKQRDQQADYADRVAEREACLVDVYDTLLSCDFVAHRVELPTLAGLTAQAWGEGYRQLGGALGLGRMSKAEGFERILRAAGAEVRPERVRALVDLDRELLLRSARLYHDALPFLRALRSRGIKIAVVSNCSEHTRDLLENNGVAALADTLVLSYEVGAEKPAEEIFSYALDQLDVTARRALFVDDQPSYCAGAAAMGITAVQIARGELDGKVPAQGTTVVRSLSDVAAMF